MACGVFPSPELSEALCDDTCYLTGTGWCRSWSRVYEDLETPITIGREEGNAIQLNDDRVSRFHVKIQEDQRTTRA